MRKETHLLKGVAHFVKGEEMKKVYCMRFELADGYYTSQFITDDSGETTLAEAKMIAREILKAEPKYYRVDFVYLMEEKG